MTDLTDLDATEVDARYKATLERLFGLTRFGEKLDLSTPRALNAALGNPLGNYRSILIGGTNGKGSTAAFLEAVLRDAGFKTGLFTSPHLVSYRERIRIDGRNLGKRSVIGLADRVIGLDLLDRQPSFFETTWAMAAEAFALAEVDIAIWEVGLGGRLDATNVCDPVASAVVSIGLDHTHVLGDTIEAIAGEKAGIFRRGRPAMTADLSAIGALQAAAPGPVALVCPQPGLPDLPLPGAHQHRNAALAMALASTLGIEPNPAALNDVRWPGRGERIGNVLLDCAHNPHAAEALAEWLKARVSGPLHLIYGAMAGKDVTGTLAALAPLVESVALVTPDYPRRQPASQILLIAQGLGMQVHDAGTVAEALASKPDGMLSLVTGSCFLVGEARAHLMGQAFPECGLRTTAR